MSFFSFLLGEKKKTASVAKERLQIILAHERSGRYPVEPDYLPALQRDLIEVIGRYIKINPEDIKVQLDREDNLEVLEVKIELPDPRLTRSDAQPSAGHANPEMALAAHPRVAGGLCHCSRGRRIRGQPRARCAQPARAACAAPGTPGASDPWRPVLDRRSLGLDRWPLPVAVRTLGRTAARSGLASPRLAPQRRALATRGRALGARPARIGPAAPPLSCCRVPLILY